MRCGLLALVLVLMACSAASAEIIADMGIANQTVLSDVVIVGSVTSVEKELAEIKAQPDAGEPTSYTVVVVKVETAIRGVMNITHIRVGFVLAGDFPSKQVRFKLPVRNLAEKNQYLLFLNTLPGSDFYVFYNSRPPKLITEVESHLAAITEAQLAAGAIADPMKALRADKPQDRALAAMVLLTHYRQPEGSGHFTRVMIDADENTAILKAIAGADWTVPLTEYWPASLAIQFLGMTEADGWHYPVVPPKENRELVYQKAFQGWLAGPGATFRFQKFIAKVKK